MTDKTSSTGLSESTGTKLRQLLLIAELTDYGRIEHYRSKQPLPPWFEPEWSVWLESYTVKILREILDGTEASEG